MSKRLPRSTSFFTFLLVLLGCSLSTWSYGQKVLQIEKVNSYKTEKFSIGTELTYKLKGDDSWYHSAIKDLLIEENIILFHNRYVHLDSIAAFRWERTKMRAVGLWPKIHAGRATLAQIDFKFRGGMLMIRRLISPLLAHVTRSAMSAMCQLWAYSAEGSTVCNALRIFFSRADSLRSPVDSAKRAGAIPARIRLPIPIRQRR